VRHDRVLPERRCEVERFAGRAAAPRGAGATIVGYNPRVVLLALVAMLAAGPAPAATPAVTLEQAQKSYFDADLDIALSQVSAIEHDEARMVDPPVDRPKVLLLKTAILLKRNDPVGAKSAAMEALSIDPDLVADAYSPSVRQFVEGVRLELPERVLVRFKDAPANADLRLDGRLVPPTGVLAVVPGTHKLVVSYRGPAAPDRRTIEVGTSDVTLSLSAKPAGSGGAVASPGGGAAPAPAGRMRALWNGPRAAPALFGVSALALVSTGVAGYEISLTQHNRRTATTPSQRAVYAPYLGRYEAEAGASVALAVACGVLGVERLHHGHARAVVVGAAPLGGDGRGAQALIAGSF